MKREWKERLYGTDLSLGKIDDFYKTPVDQFASRRLYIQRVIRKHISQNRKIRILDLGCGSGAYIYFLQEAGYKDVYGVDISEEQVAFAQKLGINNIEQQEISLFLANVQDETIDVVMLIDVLEHITRKELFDMLDEVFAG